MDEQEAEGKPVDSQEAAAPTPASDGEHAPAAEDDMDQAGPGDGEELFGSPVPEEETKAGPEVLHNALPGRVEAWRRRSAMGAVLTGFALGLQEALENRREEPAVIVQTSGEPPRDLPVEADVQQLIPSQTVVKVRPWLLDDEAEDTSTGNSPGSRTDSHGSENGSDATAPEGESGDTGRTP